MRISWCLDRIYVLRAAIEVFNILAKRHSSTQCESDVRGPRSKMNFFGSPVCKLGLARILGIGSQRLTKMQKAIRGGCDACPVDGRTTSHAKKFGSRAPSHKRGIIHDYLHGLYVKATDALPEVQATRTAPGAVGVRKGLAFRKARGKRPRIARKRDVKKDAGSSVEVRHLPHGSYMDYLKMLRAAHPTEHLSLKLFMRVPGMMRGLGLQRGLLSLKVYYEILGPLAQELLRDC